MNRRFQHRGFTLVELLVVLAIVGTLAALVLVGVMKVRESAARSQSQNNLKQIILGVHAYATANGGQLPTAGGLAPNGFYLPTVFTAILPYVEQGNAASGFPPIALFISPADPTAAAGVSQGEGISSYAANGQVFQESPNSLQNTFMDGTSNTIAFAEHYAYNCQGTSFYYWAALISAGPDHRAMFADAYGDVVPVTSGSPPVTMPSNAGFTFQVVPALCYPGIAQTPHQSGMLVALADGSVRILAPSMSEATYWAAVTPAGGEMLGDDW